MQGLPSMPIVVSDVATHHLEPSSMKDTQGASTIKHERSTDGDTEPAECREGRGGCRHALLRSGRTSRLPDSSASQDGKPGSQDCDCHNESFPGPAVSCAPDKTTACQQPVLPCSSSQACTPGVGSLNRTDEETCCSLPESASAWRDNSGGLRYWMAGYTWQLPQAASEGGCAWLWVGPGGTGAQTQLQLTLNQAQVRPGALIKGDGEAFLHLPATILSRSTLNEESIKAELPSRFYQHAQVCLLKARLEFNPLKADLCFTVGSLQSRDKGMGAWSSRAHTGLLEEKILPCGACQECRPCG